MVEECLYAVRTVVAFGGEFRELDKFGRALVHTRRGEVGSRFSKTKIVTTGWWFRICSFYMFIPLWGNDLKKTTN